MAPFRTWSVFSRGSHPRDGRIIAVLPVLLALLTIPPPASAQWNPAGVPVCACVSSEDYPIAVPDGVGGCFVVWRDNQIGGTNDDDLRASRITASGTLAPGWPANGLPVSLAPFSQGDHSVVADGQGGILIAWEDSRNVYTTATDIYAQRVLADGTLAPGWPVDGLAVCRAPDDQMLPALVPDGAGGAIIAWTDYRNGSGYRDINPDIFALRITAQGEIAPGWAADGIAVATTPAYEFAPALVSDGVGGALVAWESNGDIRGLRVTPAGEVAPGWPAAGVTLCAAPQYQFFTVGCADGASGAFFAWIDPRTYNNLPPIIPYYDLYAQHVTAGGQIPPGWPADGLPVCIAPGPQSPIHVVADGTGGVLATWADYRSNEGAIYSVRIQGSGALAAGWPVNGRLVSDLDGAEFNPAIAEDGAGGAYIAFENENSTGPWKVHAQHVTGAGAIAPGWPPAGLQVSDVADDGFEPSVAFTGSQAVVAWTTGLHGDIYAQAFVVDGPVPALASLASAEALPGEVILTWYAPAEISGAPTVSRRTVDGEWRSLGTAEQDGSGTIEFHDRAVTPGDRYAYKLAYRSGSQSLETPEVWVQVPLRLALSLEGFRPNPAGRAPVVWFTLPTGEPAVLELFDATGARRAMEHVGALGAGLHALRIGSGSLVPGVYWLRLRQGGRMLVRRGVVLE